METTAQEMKLLSIRFYGNKSFFITHFDAFKQHYTNEEKVQELINLLYPEYIKELNQTSSYLNPQLIKIFVQYCINQLSYVYENKLTFEKATCFFELSIFLFRKSWEKRWNKDKSFEELRQILVRHSLFRPPHSVYIFSLEDIKKMTSYFLNTFFRYYNAYFFSFTPLVYLEVRTTEVLIQKDQRDADIENLRQEAEQYSEITDEQLLEELMKGNSIHQIPAKKREELMRMKQEKERQERIDRILQKRLEELQQEFEDKAKQQDEEFIKKVEQLKNPKKK